MTGLLSRSSLNPYMSRDSRPVYLRTQLGWSFWVTGGFLAGLNNLDFEVTNVDGPAAVNVTGLTISGTPAA